MHVSKPCLMTPAKPELFVIMGVSASGKTTLGEALARERGIAFFDGDDFHPPANIAKMSAGQPLNDQERQGWLKRLNQEARKHRHTGAVIACSALKERYREWLSEGLEDAINWVVLTGSFDELRERIEGRKGHFMPPALLRSQFDTLELPSYGIHLQVSLSVSEMLERIREATGLRGSGAGTPA